MDLAVQIAMGIWIGLSLFALSVAAVVSGLEQADRNRRYGRPWWRSWHWR